MTNTVLVTGGSGFLACHLIKQLLERGDIVHATVRGLASSAKLSSLRAMQTAHPDRLRLFEADLLLAGSFDEAMQGCSTVYHVASPFKLPEKIKDGEKEMLLPALTGTRNVLAAVNRTATVHRVILTSTVGAIFGDYIDVMRMDQHILSEHYFNSSSTLHNNPYHYAKVQAELEAWRICLAQSRWNMVVLNPGLILGPSLSPASESGSLFLLDEMLRGVFFYGLPDLSFTTVDVRDAAFAHIQAANTQVASGRYILAERRMTSFGEMASILRAVHRRPYLLPRHRLPNWLVKTIGPLFGLTGQYLRNHLGIRFAIDNQRSVRELGVTYRPIQETLVDHYRSWAARA